MQTTTCTGLAYQYEDKCAKSQVDIVAGQITGGLVPVLGGRSWNSCSKSDGVEEGYEPKRMFKKIQREENAHA